MNQRNIVNYKQFIAWKTISTQIIDVCVALQKIDLPAYILLEIVDWSPLSAKSNRKKKIDLIINVKKSIENILKEKKIE